MPVGMNVVGVAGVSAEVDANNQVMVTTNQDPTKAGAARMYDAGGNAILVEENGALSVSQDELILSEQVDGSALNTNRWITSVSTMAIAQAGGFITLNSAASTTSGAYAILQSINQIPLYGDMPVEYAFNAKVGIVAQSNAVMEMGLGFASGVSLPTDGAFFRWNSSGAFQAVVNNGGVETAVNCVMPAGSTVLLAPINDSQLYSIIISEDHVQFSIDDELVADIVNPPAIAYPVNAGHQPVFARVYNGGSSPSQAPQLSIGQVMVRQISVQTFKTWRDRVASFGMAAYQSPVTPFGQTANHANSTGPVAGVLSNTAAAYTTLGGRYSIAAVIGAATDYALFGFQVPAPFKLYVTGVTITSMVTGAAVGITPSILDWAIGVNASAVSLATADGAGTWAPRRIPLGMQGMIAAALLGAAAPDIARTFDPPLVVDANRFLHIILQIPVGLATASLVFRGNVVVSGYFE